MFDPHDTILSFRYYLLKPQNLEPIPLSSTSQRCAVEHFYCTTNAYNIVESWKKHLNLHTLMCRKSFIFTKKGVPRATEG